MSTERSSGDWTEPGAHPVAEGVWRIPLPLPSVGLRAVNVYVLTTPQGLVLVDGGWSAPDGFAALRHGLAQLGCDTADVARIAVTHAHHDHYTQALDLRARHGVAVLLGRGERPSVAAMAPAEGVQEAAAGAGRPAPQAAMLRRAGAPELAVGYLRLDESRRRADTAPWGEPDHWLDDGEQLDVGDRRLEIVATPGHTRGHIVLRDAAGGLLFAGDHVLPHITPSIGYERAPEPAPLRSYLHSLRLVHDRPDTLLLPAHGPTAPSVHTRVAELLGHHEQRLDDALRRVRAGASTAFEVADAMDWTRARRRLVDLETEHGSLAVLEIAAHLDLLVEVGSLGSDEHDGVAYYRVR